MFSVRKYSNDEAQTLQCRADSGGVETDRNRDAGNRADSSREHFGANLLSLEDGIRRFADGNQVRQLTLLKDENVQLKKIVEELMSDKAMLTDVLKNVERPRQVRSCPGQSDAPRTCGILPPIQTTLDCK